MTTARRVVCCVALPLVLVACADDASDAPPVAEAWCGGLQSLADQFAAGAFDEPLSPERIERWQATVNELLEVGAPAEIAEDFEIAREPERFNVSPYKPNEEAREQERYARADAKVFGWVLDHCDLSHAAENALREDHQETLEILEYHEQR